MRTFRFRLFKMMLVTEQLTLLKLGQEYGSRTVEPLTADREQLRSSVNMVKLQVFRRTADGALATELVDSF